MAYQYLFSLISLLNKHLITSGTRLTRLTEISLKSITDFRVAIWGNVHL